MDPPKEMKEGQGGQKTNSFVESPVADVGAITAIKMALRQKASFELLPSQYKLFAVLSSKGSVWFVTAVVLTTERKKKIRKASQNFILDNSPFIHNTYNTSARSKCIIAWAGEL